MDQQQTEELVKATIWKLLGGKESLQKKNLLKRLAVSAGLTELAVQETLAGLVQKNWLSGVYSNGIPVGKIIPLVERPAPPLDPSFAAWREALVACDLNEEEQAALLPIHALTKDFPEEDRRHLVCGLLQLREKHGMHKGEPTFIVSATYLLGSSKLLDALPNKALRAFGIDTGLFTGAPPVVLIAGPKAPRNVVLVENPHAFWRAISTTAIEETAFLVTFGYGLSRHGEDYGNQLATLLEIEAPLVGAVCAGNPPPANDLLKHVNISFWGDLDYEGVRIYSRLKKKIPCLQLSALYRPMLDAITDLTRSHPYAESAAKSKQVRVTMEACGEDCGKLYAICVNRAVDQESLTGEEIILYAGLKL
jgi:hypothetical protein